MEINQNLLERLDDEAVELAGVERQVGGEELRQVTGAAYAVLHDHLDHGLPEIPLRIRRRLHHRRAPRQHPLPLPPRRPAAPAHRRLLAQPHRRGLALPASPAAAPDVDGGGDCPFGLPRRLLAGELAAQGRRLLGGHLLPRAVGDVFELVEPIRETKSTAAHGIYVGFARDRIFVIDFVRDK